MQSLTNREKQVFDLIMQRIKTREIQNKLSMTSHELYEIRNQIYNKGILYSNKNLLLAFLTYRELQVFDLILLDLKTHEQGKKLKLENSTVRTYHKQIYEKLFVNSKKELIRKYKGKQA